MKAKEGIFRHIRTQKFYHHCVSFSEEQKKKEKKNDKIKMKHNDFKQRPMKNTSISTEQFKFYSYSWQTDGNRMNLKMVKKIKFLKLAILREKS